jgi:integrase
LVPSAKEGAAVSIEPTKIRVLAADEVQDWVGHANIQNTMIYARVTNSRRDEMATRLKDWR